MLESSQRTRQGTDANLDTPRYPCPKQTYLAFTEFASPSQTERSAQRHRMEDSLIRQRCRVFAQTFRSTGTPRTKPRTATSASPRSLAAGVPQSPKGSLLGCVRRRQTIVRGFDSLSSPDHVRSAKSLSDSPVHNHASPVHLQPRETGNCAKKTRFWNETRSFVSFRSSPSQMGS